LINRNAKFIHLSIPPNFDYQLHHIPGAEHCLSELESFNYHSNITNQNILEGLAKICKSIKKLRFFYNSNFFYTYSNYDNNWNPGIIKLIDVQMNLIDISLINCATFADRSINKSLEESLIKHADTVQYFRIDYIPITRILSYFVNLLCLEINSLRYWNESDYLNNLSFPILKILKTHQIPSKILANLIENTKGYLSEISIFNNNINNIEKLIQAIYQNCPNLKYLRLSLIVNSNLLLLEFENLLISCQFLNGLVLDIYYNTDLFDLFSWSKFFEILTKTSPISLFKFKFTYIKFKLEDFKLLFDNWEGKPILLEIRILSNCMKKKQQFEDLTEKYKVKGIIKQYLIGVVSIYDDDDFEWI